ncbi:2-dehydro-3-deoxy-6-phosphogalactonate aldolase, partial [Mesorhizobium sp. M1D.F.Ca.ET.234.01.1.1]
MSQTAPFPKLKRGLVAILRGLKPAEAISMG